ncbi:MAG: polysaccharide biosynthesis C-terminal domain-containing protein [Planctomycetes bacterium]|nr:polysaccharide biosynthesis C-terminal domain-containing protein [Planctomycetota bacterium]
MVPSASGSPTRGVLRLAAPLVLSFWFRAAFQWVDTAYASMLEGVGDASIAAIGLAVPFEFLMIACWVGTSNSLTSRLSAAMGAREGERVAQLLAAARRIVVGLTVLFLAVAAGIWFVTPHLDLDPLVARQFRVYGTVLLAGSSLTTFWSVLPDSIVKAHHDMRSTMWAGMASTATNVTLNTVFVFAFGWGLFGIALATVLGRLGGLAYALRQANRHERARLADGNDDAPGRFERPVRTLLGFALPAGLSFVFLAVEGMAFNALLAGRPDAAELLPAWSILDRAGRFLVMPMIATGVALLPLTARLVGAGDASRIRRELRTAAAACAGYCLLVVAPLALWAGPPLVDALVESPDARTAAVHALRWLPLGIALGFPLLLLRPTFEGLQRPRLGLAISALRALALVVPLGVAGARFAPQYGLGALEGLVLGGAFGAGLASLAAALWMRRVLRAEGSAVPSRA